MKHTPGPWEVSTDDDGIYIRGVDPNYGKTLLASYIWSVEDALLIHAAPELLEALESLVNLCATGDGSEEHQQYEPEEMKCARAAIAKAKGTQS